ncbi:MAG: DUF222 domain-containing protein, partial [Acidimicrobiales bacterium]
RETVAVMGTVNAAMARLVRTIRMLIDTEGWGGVGIRSVEHWVSWKAAVSSRRAGDLATVARRIHELPCCFALFEAGRLTEDAMVRIARRVPASHDATVAERATGFLISQLDRTLAALPPLGEPEPDRLEHRFRRRCDMWNEEGGWLGGRFCLPPDEGAALRNGLAAARDAEFRDRQGLEPDASLDEVGETVRRSTVSQADALVRMASEAADSLDAELQRTGRRGDRNKIVLHHDVEHDGTLGPGQLHLGPVVPDLIARYLACDAEVMVASYRLGQLIGVHPTERTVSRALRRVVERRDQGCTHPLCTQRRFLHVHHLRHWEDGGETVPANLLCLCPRHHREHHQGEFTIEGDPERAGLRFLNPWGRPIEPPGTGSPDPVRIDEPSPFQPPYGERLSSRWFDWN